MFTVEPRSARRGCEERVSICILAPIFTGTLEWEAFSRSKIGSEVLMQGRS
jgi:hypothetical protein